MRRGGCLRQTPLGLLDSYILLSMSLFLSKRWSSSHLFLLLCSPTSQLGFVTRPQSRYALRTHLISLKECWPVLYYSLPSFFLKNKSFQSLYLLCMVKRLKAIPHVFLDMPLLLGYPIFIYCIFTQIRNSNAAC